MGQPRGQIPDLRHLLRLPQPPLQHYAFLGFAHDPRPCGLQIRSHAVDLVLEGRELAALHDFSARAVPLDAVCQLAAPQGTHGIDEALHRLRHQAPHQPERQEGHDHEQREQIQEESLPECPLLLLHERQRLRHFECARHTPIRTVDRAENGEHIVIFELAPERNGLPRREHAGEGRRRRRTGRRHRV